MNRHTDDDLVRVVDGQTVDVEMGDTPDGTVAVRFRPGLILTPKFAAIISGAHRDSKNADNRRPRDGDG